MGITFNPFTGTLDFTGAGGGTATTPALPFDSVQFNNAGAFGGSADLTWNGSELRDVLGFHAGIDETSLNPAIQGFNTTAFLVTSQSATAQAAFQVETENTAVSGNAFAIGVGSVAYGRNVQGFGSEVIATSGYGFAVDGFASTPGTGASVTTLNAGDFGVTILADTVSSSAGFHVTQPYIEGTVTALHGLLIDDIDDGGGGGTIGTAYAIKTGVGIVQFNGSRLTLAGNLTTSGAFASTFTMTNTTAVTFPTSGTLATTSQIPSGAALTKGDDTNVTLTLGGSASTALINAASITAGWSGTLSVARGGSGAGTLTGLVLGNGTSAFTTVTAPSGTVVGTSDTQTLTNKRITKRVVTASDATSITPNTDNADVTYQANTQAAGTLTINADSGTPTNGQGWVLKIKSTNAQTLSFNAIYVGGAIALPTTTTGSSKIDYFAFVYDTVTPKWDYTGTAAGF